MNFSEDGERKAELVEKRRKTGKCMYVCLSLCLMRITACDFTTHYSPTYEENADTVFSPSLFQLSCECTYGFCALHGFLMKEKEIAQGDLKN